MREILYRLKICGKWAYGLPCKIRQDTVAFDGVFADGQSVYDAFANKETLSEFTGLSDKNGKKIFEGDIIKVITKDTHEERLIEVCIGEFTDDGSGDLFIGAYLKYEGFAVSAGQIKEFGADSVELIGNIYDNPELLEK